MLAIVFLIGAVLSPFTVVEADTTFAEQQVVKKKLEGYWVSAASQPIECSNLPSDTHSLEDNEIFVESQGDPIEVREIESTFIYKVVRVVRSDNFSTTIALSYSGGGEGESSSGKSNWYLNNVGQDSEQLIMVDTELTRSSQGPTTTVKSPFARAYAYVRCKH